MGRVRVQLGVLNGRSTLDAFKTAACRHRNRTWRPLAAVRIPAPLVVERTCTRARRCTCTARRAVRCSRPARPAAVPVAVPA